MEQLQALPELRILVLSEDWCGDAVNTLPLVARMAEAAPNIELRVIGRDDNPDLMDSHMTGASRSIPVVIVYDGDFNELAWTPPDGPAALGHRRGPLHALQGPVSPDPPVVCRGSWSDDYARGPGQAVFLAASHRRLTPSRSVERPPGDPFARGFFAFCAPEARLRTHPGVLSA